MRTLKCVRRRQELRFMFIVAVGVIVGSLFFVADSYSGVAVPVWNSINSENGYGVVASGDPLAAEASVLIAVLEHEDDDFGGAISSTLASGFRGKLVTLKAQLSNKGRAEGSIWLRADGDRKPLAFATSAHAWAGDSEIPIPHQVSMFVPANAEQLVFGIIVRGAGSVSADGVSIRIVERNEQSDRLGAPLLKEAISLVEENALNAESLNWDQKRLDLLRILESYGDSSELAHVLISQMLGELRDNHSYLMPSEDVKRFEVSGVRRGEAIVRVLDDGIGYVRIPGFVGADRHRSLEFSQQVEREIFARAPQVEAGWIIDLRGNTGGNMWPMLAALESFLGDGTLGFFQDRRRQSSPWQLESYVPREQDLDLTASRVALLTSSKTASSGEAIAIAFRGRPGTKSFGTKTAGLATGNTGFKLTDGSQIMLTTSLMLDRRMQSYPSGVMPDVLISTSSKAEAEIPSEVISWLKGGG